MNREILSDAVQQFLLENENTDPRKIALSKSPFAGVSSSELASQIESRQKTKKKLPLWYRTYKIYYPAGLSIEQTSSEQTARYKTRLISGGSIIDLTGGFGVDSFYFSRKAVHVTHCEINEELSEIAKHNADRLGRDNIYFFAGNGVDFILDKEINYDTVFIDPSRRVKLQKVFKISDCEPDIVQWQEQILTKCSRLIIKASPLLDISLSLFQLNHVKEVRVLSVKNECKELLFILEKEYAGEVKVIVALLDDDKETEFEFNEGEERACPLILGSPQTYLYDPDSGLLKAGLFKSIAHRFGLKKLHLNTHLYTSSDKIDDFPGRTLRITEIMDYKDFKKRKESLSANVITKNFPIKAEEVRKKHRIGESENDFLFFCKTMDDSLTVIFAKRD